MTATTIFESRAVSVSDHRRSAGPGDRPYAEQYLCHSIAYMRKGSFGCRMRGYAHKLVAGALLIGHPGDEYTCDHAHHDGGDECLAFSFTPEGIDAIGGGVPDSGLRGSVAPLSELMVLG